MKEDNNNNHQTYRQLFGNFRKSNEGRDVKSMLYREQLFCCCSCMKSFDIHRLEMHHLKPISLLEKELDLINVTAKSNLVLLCRSCNAKQSNKVDTRFS